MVDVVKTSYGLGRWNRAMDVEMKIKACRAESHRRPGQFHLTFICHPPSTSIPFSNITVLQHKGCPDTAKKSFEDGCSVTICALA